MNFWFVAYAVGVVLIPPIHYKSKNIFAAEWMLVPLFLIFLFDVIRSRKIYMPSKILWVILALIVAFFSGMWRGNIGVALAPYNGFFDDRFNFGQDLIRALRWLIIFSTPWWISEIIIRHKTKDSIDIFVKALTACVFISASMAILEHWKLISVARLYTPEFSFDNAWVDRSSATFQSPLDAGLVFAAFGALTLNKILKVRDRVFENLIILAVLFYALILTKTGTALGALAIYLLYSFSSKFSRRNPFIIPLILGIGFFGIIFLIFPQSWILLKFGNFAFRARTWIRFIKEIPTHPQFLISGMGFTNMVVDSSVLMLLVDGGVLLLLSSSFWIKDLFRWVPKETFPIFLIWVVSWLSLDSIGFWGIGRICWVLLGLGLANMQKQKPEVLSVGNSLR